MCFAINPFWFMDLDALKVRVYAKVTEIVREYSLQKDWTLDKGLNFDDWNNDEDLLNGFKEYAIAMAKYTELYNSSHGAGFKKGGLICNGDSGVRKNDPDEKIWEKMLSICKEIAATLSEKCGDKRMEENMPRFSNMVNTWIRDMEAEGEKYKKMVRIALEEAEYKIISIPKLQVCKEWKYDWWVTYPRGKFKPSEAIKIMEYKHRSGLRIAKEYEKQMGELDDLMADGEITEGDYLEESNELKMVWEKINKQDIKCFKEGWKRATMLLRTKGDDAGTITLGWTTTQRAINPIRDEAAREEMRRNLRPDVWDEGGVRATAKAALAAAFA